MNRSMIDKNYSLVKRMVDLFLTINVVEGTHATTLLKWNYGTFNQGPNIRTYTAAAVPATALPTGNGPWPDQYQAGSEGSYSITRASTGLYTLVLQDNYERLVGLAAYAASAGGTPTFASISENTTISNTATVSGTAVIGLAFWDFAGSLVDPIGQVRIHLTLADSSSP